MGTILAVAAIWGWLPIVLMIFSVWPPRQAMVTSFVVGWLYLPDIGFDLPGLPDWTKMSATTIGAALGLLIFDSARLFSFRPKWYDVPMLVWCTTSFASSISNNQGAYDGFSVVVDNFFTWGLPYLLGRVALNDAEGARALALAVVIGGLSYIPLCLIEMRLSTVLRGWVFGMPRWEGTRYGGYRPAVFLRSGLELGMWMVLSCLMAERLWASGAVRQIKGYSFRMLCLALLVTTVLCRSTGALCLLAFGWLLLWLTGRAGRSWPIWLAIAIPPIYCTTRTTGMWSGASAVEIAKATVGEDRAQSLEFRFQCEENHIYRSLMRPILGFSRNGEFRRAGGNILETIVDGFWTATFGVSGLSGLITLNVMLLLPMALTIRRFPVKTWREPEVAPVVALALFLVLLMIDNLSNAMLNPIYAVTMGAVSGMSATAGRSRGKAGAALAGAQTLSEQGRPEEALHAFSLAAELSTPARGQADPATMGLHADALAGMALTCAQTGRRDEAEDAMRDAIDIRLELASGLHDAERVADLASGHEELARLLSESGRIGEAVGERRKALALWDTLAASRLTELDYRGHRVACLNDLAWLLAADADGNHRDPEAAVSLATEAARNAPEDPACWNTLGVARYRSGDWAGAFEALEHSVNLSRTGGTAFDHYFLAMASARLGEIEHARGWFDLAVDWSDRHRPGHPGLGSFRSEAVALLVESGGKPLKHLTP